MTEAHGQIPGLLGRPGTGRVRCFPGDVQRAGVVLDDDQYVEAVEQHGVDCEEITGDYAAGLRGEELLPGRPGSARCRIDAGGGEDLPDRGGRDPVPESGQLALDAAMPPARVCLGEAEDERLDGSHGRRATRPAAPGVIPLSGGEFSVPAQHGRRRHREDFRPAVAS
jgi:hypothetical protein